MPVSNLPGNSLRSYFMEFGGKLVRDLLPNAQRYQLGRNKLRPVNHHHQQCETDLSKGLPNLIF